MELSHKKLTQLRISKIVELKNIKNNQKIQIFENLIKELETEEIKYKIRIRKIMLEQLLMRNQIKKLSTKGWNKFQS